MMLELQLPKGDGGDEGSLKVRSSVSSTCAVITKKVPYRVDTNRIFTSTVDSIHYYCAF